MKYLSKNINDVNIYRYHPKTWGDLFNIVHERIKAEGPNCNLNDIDVSKVTNISGVFYNSKFNGDISKWDVSNVKIMKYMFENTPLEGKAPDWYKPTHLV